MGKRPGTERAMRKHGLFNLPKMSGHLNIGSNPVKYYAFEFSSLTYVPLCENFILVHPSLTPLRFPLDISIEARRHLNSKENSKHTQRHDHFGRYLYLHM